MSGDDSHEKSLRLYIHDYLVKKGFNDIALAFKSQCLVQDPNDVQSLIDIPKSFLLEGWSLFRQSEIFSNFIKRHNELQGPQSHNLGIMSVGTSMPVGNNQKSSSSSDEITILVNAVLSNMDTGFVNSLPAPAPNIQDMDIRRHTELQDPQSHTLGSMSVGTSMPVGNNQDVGPVDLTLDLQTIWDHLDDQNIYDVDTDITEYSAGLERLISNKDIDLLYLTYYRSVTRLVCCDISINGKNIACGSDESKAAVFSIDPLEPLDFLEKHTDKINDIRFSPNSDYVATASNDRTVKIWDLKNDPHPYSVRSIQHKTAVQSLDFSPHEDIICTCDLNKDTKYWSYKTGTQIKVFKAGKDKVRFQPTIGKYLAVVSDQAVSILDSDSQTCYYTFEAHSKKIQSICWSSSGDYFISLSSDEVKVWNFKWGKAECMNVLESGVNRYFRSCIFCPKDHFTVIIGSCKELEIWTWVTEGSKKTIATNETNDALAASGETLVLASLSKILRKINLWKIVTK